MWQMNPRRPKLYIKLCHRVVGVGGGVKGVGGGRVGVVGGNIHVVVG